MRNKKLVLSNLYHHGAIKKLFAENFDFCANADFLFVQILKKLRTGFFYAHTNALLVFVHFGKQLFLRTFQNSIFIRDWISMRIKVRVPQEIVQTNNQLLGLYMFQLFSDFVDFIPMEF